MEELTIAQQDSIERTQAAGAISFNGNASERVSQSAEKQKVAPLVPEETGSLSISATQHVSRTNWSRQWESDGRAVEADVNAGLTLENIEAKYGSGIFSNTFAIPHLARAKSRRSREDVAFPIIRDTKAFAAIANEVNAESTGGDWTRVKDKKKKAMISLFLNSKGFSVRDYAQIDEELKTGVFKGKSLDEVTDWVFNSYLAEQARYDNLAQFVRTLDTDKQRFLEENGYKDSTDFFVKNAPEEMGNNLLALQKMSPADRRVAVEIAAKMREADSLGEWATTTYQSRIAEKIGTLSPERQARIMAMVQSMNPKLSRSFGIELAGKVAESFSDTFNGLENFLEAGFVHAGAWFNDLDIDEHEWYKREQTARNAALNTVRTRYAERGAIGSILMDTGVAFADTASIMALGWATGGIGAAAGTFAWFGGGSAGNAYTDLISRGVDTDTAFYSALEVGAVEAGSEYLQAVIPLGKGVSNFIAGKGAKSMALNMLSKDYFYKVASGEVAATTKNALMRAAGRAALGMVEETGTELVAVGNKALVYDALGVSVDGEFLGEVSDTVKTMPGVFLLGALTGTGAAKLRNRGKMPSVTQFGTELDLTKMESTKQKAQAMRLAGQMLDLSFDAGTGTVRAHGWDGRVTEIDMDAWADMSVAERRQELEAKFFRGEQHDENDTEKAMAFFDFVQKTAEFTADNAKAATDVNAPLDKDANAEAKQAAGAIPGTVETSTGTPTPEAARDALQDFVERMPIWKELGEAAPDMDISSDLSAAFGYNVEPEHPDVAEALKTLFERGDADATLAQILNEYAKSAIAQAKLGGNAKSNPLALLVEKANAFGDAGGHTGERIAEPQQGEESAETTIPQTALDDIPNTGKYFKTLSQASGVNVRHIEALSGNEYSLSRARREVKSVLSGKKKLAQISDAGKALLRATMLFDGNARALADWISAYAAGARKGGKNTKELEDAAFEFASGSREQRPVSEYESLRVETEAKSEAEQNLLRTVSRLNAATGGNVSVKFFDGSFFDANGFIDKNNVVHINRNAPEPLLKTFGHEFTHYLEANKGFAGMKKYILNPDGACVRMFLDRYGFSSLESAKEKYKKLYGAQGGQNLSDEAVEREILADVCGAVLFTRDFDALFEIRQENKNFFNRCLEFLRKLFRATRGTKIENDIANAIGRYRAVAFEQREVLGSFSHFEQDSAKSAYNPLKPAKSADNSPGKGESAPSEHDDYDKGNGQTLSTNFVVFRKLNTNEWEIPAEITAAVPALKGKVVCDKEAYEHIWEHESELRLLGYESEEQFMSETLSKITAVYDKGNGYDLVADVRQGAKNVNRVVVYLKKTNSGDFYDVGTAHVIRKGYFKNKKPLWERTPNVHNGVANLNSPQGTMPTTSKADDSNATQATPERNEKLLDSVSARNDVGGVFMAYAKEADLHFKFPGQYPSFRSVLELVAKKRGVPAPGVFAEAAGAVAFAQKHVGVSKTETTTPAEIKPNEFEALTPSAENAVRIKGHYRVVDLSELKFVDVSDKSQQDEQERNRSGKRTEEQVQRMLMNFESERLGDDRHTDRGAPIYREIDGGLRSVSGEGRSRLLKKVYELGGVPESQYREHVAKFARERGIEIPESVKQPVLLRIATDTGGLTWAQLAKASNTDMKSVYSTAEEAHADARELPKILNLLSGRSDEGILDERNNAFIMAFNEAIGAGTQYTQDRKSGFKETIGLRIENALVAYVINDREAATDLFDSPYSLGKTLASLRDHAVDLVRLKDNEQYDIAPELAAALKAALHTKKQKESGNKQTQQQLIELYFEQNTFDFEQNARDGIDLGAAKMLANLMLEKRTSRLGYVLFGYIDEVERANGIDGNDIGLFGTQDWGTKSELMQKALDKINGDAGDVRYSISRKGRGYMDGGEWSQRANSALFDGMRPAAMIAKDLGVPVRAVELYGKTREWHHVGADFEEVDFYDPNDWAVQNVEQINNYEDAENFIRYVNTTTHVLGVEAKNDEEWIPKYIPKNIGKNLTPEERRKAYKEWSDKLLAFKYTDKNSAYAKAWNAYRAAQRISHAEEELKKLAENKITFDAFKAFAEQYYEDAVRTKKEQEKAYKQILKEHGDFFKRARDQRSKVGASGLRYSLGSSRGNAEAQRIEAEAKANGTWLKAPNGKPSKLTPRQWVQVRTKAFKEWFGDWEKAARIEKLKNSVPVEISGNEIAFGESVKENVKLAKQYAKNFRGEYTNNDTGNTIPVFSGSVNELSQHDRGSKAHLQSFAAIPQIIENSVYITTLANEDLSAHPGIKEFEYYVCGLKIGGIDYTVKAVVAVERNGARYYDHKLTQIEKGALLSSLSDVTKSAGKAGTPFADIKDKRLLSILQVDSSKVVDENGEPLVVYHGSRTGGHFYEFANNSFFSDDFDTADMFKREADFDLYVNGKLVGTVGDEDAEFLANELSEGDYTAKDIAGWGEITREDISSDYVIDEVRRLSGYEVSEDEIETVRLVPTRGVFDVFLNIRNPLVVDYGGKVWMNNNFLPEDKIKEARKKKEHDGVVVKNIVEGGFTGEYRGGGEPRPSTDYIPFSPAQIKSATDNVGTFDAGNPDIRYSLIGERGAAAMDAATDPREWEMLGIRSRMQNLNTAREMEAAGKSRAEILYATGWYRGKDKKWRREIDDGKIKSGIEPHVDGEGVKWLSLGEIYEAPELYKAYPELKEMRVEFVPMIKVLAQYEELDKTIRLPLSWIRVGKLVAKRAKNSAGLLPTLVHEIQHAIQHKEGFAQGGNPNTRNPDVIATLGRRIEDAKNSIAEIRKELAKIENEEISPIDDKFAAWWESHGADADPNTDADFRKLNEAYDAATEKRDALLEAISDLEKSITDNAAKIRGDFSSLGMSGYRRLAGEVEARNVSRRLDDKHASPWNTEDVAEEEQIVLQSLRTAGAVRWSLSQPSLPGMEAAGFDLFDKVVPAEEKPVLEALKKQKIKRVAFDAFRRKEGERKTLQDIQNTFGLISLKIGKRDGKPWTTTEEIYDALLDLAEIADIPPAAIGLGGRLALEFTGRHSTAKGGSYKPFRRYITIFQRGVVAHEWLHALDNYFGGALGPRLLKNPYNGTNIRRDVLESFENLYKVVKDAEFAKRSWDYKGGGYWVKPEELVARAFEVYAFVKRAYSDESLKLAEEAETIAKEYKFKSKTGELDIRSEEAKAIRARWKEIYDKAQQTTPLLASGKNLWELQVYPKPEELESDGTTAAFDKLFETLEWEQQGRNVRLYSLSMRNSMDALEAVANGAPYGVLHNAKYGEIHYPLGRMGKGGFGFLHIVEQRIKKDGATIDEAIEIALRVGIAAEIGEETKEKYNTHHLDYGGTRAIIATMKHETPIITGYKISADAQDGANRRSSIATQSQPHVSSETILSALKKKLAQMRGEVNPETRFSLSMMNENESFEEWASRIPKLEPRKKRSADKARLHDINARSRRMIQDFIREHNELYSDPKQVRKLKVLGVALAKVLLERKLQSASEPILDAICKDAPAILRNDIKARGEMLARLMRENLDNAQAVQATIEDIAAMSNRVGRMRAYARLASMMNFGSAEAYDAIDALARERKAKLAFAQARDVDKAKLEQIGVTKRLNAIGLSADLSQDAEDKRRRMDEMLTEAENDESDGDDAGTASGATEDADEGGEEAPAPGTQKDALKQLQDTPKAVAHELVQLVLDTIFGEGKVRAARMATDLKKIGATDEQIAGLVKTLRKTATKALMDAMHEAVPVESRSRIGIVIGKIATEDNPARIRKLLENGFNLVALSTTRATRAQAYQKINRLLKPFARMKSRESNLNRRMDGERELYFHACYKAWTQYHSMKQAADRMEEIQKDLTALGANTEPTENDFAKRKVLERELHTLSLVGGARVKSVIDLLQVAWELEHGIENDREEHENNVEAVRERNAEAYGEIANAVRARKAVPDRKQGVFEQLFTGVESFRQRLEGLIRFAGGATEAVARERIEQMDKDLANAAYRKESMAYVRVHALRDALEKIFGRDMAGELKRWHQHNDALAKFSGDGKTPLTLAQVANIYAQVRQEHYAKPLKERDSFKKEDIELIERRLAQLDEMEAVLGEKGVAVVDALCGLLRDIQPELRAAFKGVTGYEFFTEENYFPIQRQGARGVGLGLKGINLSALPLRFSTRIVSAVDIAEDSSIFDVFDEAAGASEHFIAYSQSHLFWQQAFADPNFSDVIRKHHGKTVLNDFREHVTNILSPEQLNFGNVEIVNRFTSLAAISALGANTLVMLRQITGLPAFMFNMRTMDFGKYLGSFASANGLNAIREIWKNNPWFRTRIGKAFHKELDAMTSGDGAFAAGKARALAWYMISNNLGDAVPILFVGQGIFRATYEACINKGMNEEQAKEAAHSEVARYAESSQQSNRVMNMSVFNRKSSSVARAVQQFKSTTQQFLSYEVRAISDVMARPTDAARWRRLGKVVMLNHFILPGAYSATTMLFDLMIGNDMDEWSEEWFSKFVMPMLLGPASGIFFVGDALTTIGGGLSRGLPAAEIISKGRRLWRAGTAMIDEDTDKALDETFRFFMDNCPPLRHAYELYENRIE